MSETGICRLCANFIDSTKAERIFERSRRKLLRQIEELIGQRLRNIENLPKLICEKCQEQTLQSHIFRECCIQTQKHFKTAAYKQHIRNRALFTNEKLKLFSAEGHKLKKIPPIQKVFLNDKISVKAGQEVNKNVLILNKAKDTLLKHEPVVMHTDNSSVSDAITAALIDIHEIQIEQKQKCSIDVEDMIATSEVETLSSDVSFNYKPNKLLRVERLCRKSKTRKLDENKNNKSKKPKTVGEKPDYICDQCGTHFNNFTIFTTHLRRHAGEKPFQCEICPDKFLSQAQLLRHIRKHTGEKPYPCRHCNRRFLDSSARVRHERVHRNERPFVCQQCGKSFTVSYTLKEHMRIHTGERAFVCKICNVSFTLKAHLVTHYRSMTHKQNEEKQQDVQNETHAAVAVEASKSLLHLD